jgi:S1-C subfamily serine protease
MHEKACPTLLWLLLLSGCREEALPPAAPPAPPTALELRRSSTVELVEKVAPSAVDMESLVSDETGLSAYYGSGTIIHEKGYVLTCNHAAVQRGEPTVRLYSADDTDPYILALQMWKYDLAILKVETDKEMVPAAIGSSDDIMLGEKILVIGNPSGQWHTTTEGIVSGLWRGEWEMFQTDAAINPGNSGGPAFNAAGELIGIVQVMKPEMQNAGYAIPINRAREVLAEIMSNDTRSGIRIGVYVDPYGTPQITNITAELPGMRAGLRAGDVITRVDDMEVRDSMHYYLSLLGHKPGDTIEIGVLRHNQPATFTVTLAEAPMLPAVEVDGLAAGLKVESFMGEWDYLPDFEQLQAVTSSIVAGFGVDSLDDDMELFGLRFTGYIRVPTNGLYTIYTTSDDGSMLRLDGAMIVDNDGLHWNSAATRAWKPACMKSRLLSSSERGGSC